MKIQIFNSRAEAQTFVDNQGRDAFVVPSEDSTHWLLICEDNKEGEADVEIPRISQ